MALRIIEGVIGSGKTYYAVRHVAKSYFTFNPDLQIWQPKDPQLVIYSNIDRFALAQPLMPLIDAVGGVASFFNVDYQKTFVQDKKVVYVIDEAQSPQFFHRKFYNPQVFFFFQYHRHLGVDIYLITQDIWSLAKEFRELAEYHIKARRRVQSMLGEFTYFFMCGDEKWKTQTFKPEKQYFQLYQSMQSKEVEKLGSASRRYAFIFALLIAVAFLLFYYGFLGLFMPSTNKQAQASNTPSKSILSKLSNNPDDKKLMDNPSLAQPPSPKGDLVAEPAVPDTQSKETIEITISGIIASGDYQKFMFTDEYNREFTVTGFQMDKICLCSAINKLKTGDSLSVSALPKGLIFRKLQSSSNTTIISDIPSGG